jgi:hypothetical protein
MGLFDGYFNPERFREGGGLLGRILALQEARGPNEPATGVDQSPSGPQAALQPIAWPNLPGYDMRASNLQAVESNLVPLDRTSPVPLGDRTRNSRP